MKKIVLKVSIMCSKCKVCILTTISKFEGIVSMAVDAEKSTVTIVGVVDAVRIVKALRKTKKPAEIVSVGEPDKKEDKKDDKKDDKKKEDDKKEPCKLPPCCNACKHVIVWQDEPNVCTIC